MTMKCRSRRLQCIRHDSGMSSACLTLTTHKLPQLRFCRISQTMTPRRHYSNSKAKRLQASASTRGTHATQGITRSRVACSRLDSHATALDKTSIHCLPLELLTEIFTFVMEVNSDELYFKKSSGGGHQQIYIFAYTLTATYDCFRNLGVPYNVTYWLV